MVKIKLVVNVWPSSLLGSGPSPQYLPRKLEDVPDSFKVDLNFFIFRIISNGKKNCVPIFSLLAYLEVVRLIHVLKGS